MTQRVITALVLVTIGLLTIFYGGFPLLVLIHIASIAIAYEIMGMMQHHNINVSRGLGYCIAVMIPSTLIWAPYIWQHPITKIIALALVLLGIAEFVQKKLWVPKHPVLATIKLVGMITMLLVYIYLVREGFQGLTNLLFGCVIIWVTDTTALFAGKYFGKHQLSIISPKKTWEGSVSAIMGSILAAIVMIVYFERSWLTYIPLAIAVSVLSQIGDLHESLTKRYFDVKDSSNLLPGHGGFYDRADGYLLVMPIIFYIFNV